MDRFITELPDIARRNGWPELARAVEYWRDGKAPVKVNRVPWRKGDCGRLMELAAAWYERNSVASYWLGGYRSAFAEAASEATPNKEQKIKLTQPGGPWQASPLSREHLRQLKTELSKQRVGKPLQLGGVDFPSLLVGFRRVDPLPAGAVDDVIATLHSHLHLLLADGFASEHGTEKSLQIQVTRLKVLAFDEFHFKREESLGVFDRVGNFSPILSAFTYLASKLADFTADHALVRLLSLFGNNVPTNEDFRRYDLRHPLPGAVAQGAPKGQWDPSLRPSRDFVILSQSITVWEAPPKASAQLELLD